ncbi:tetratricopeptide repeat protein [Pendulispora albinea]|uniref:Sel1 repeat family protein n=1 Tax=Pendulispora albinea TaxID=2741071 RepID=A0ABZ2MCX1_9BACT
MAMAAGAAAIWTSDFGAQTAEEAPQESRESHENEEQPRPSSAREEPQAPPLPSFVYLQTRTEAREVHEAIETLTKAANDGNVIAELTLGKAYLQGVPTLPKDPARAHDWFARAAETGNANAAYYMGVMSKSGEGTKRDPEEAIRWFEKAADAGSAHAMLLLANAYRNGEGVAADPKKALDLYQRAAELDHPAALQALAMAYQRGELGLSPDEAESRRYTMEAEHALQHAPDLP